VPEEETVWAEQPDKDLQAKGEAICVLDLSAQYKKTHTIASKI
jgi:hypothetical protein